MRQIPLKYVKKDNSNIRGFSDTLWRELRKTRYKPARPEAMTNQMAAEAYTKHEDLAVEFRHDINRFIADKLSTREAVIFRMYLFCSGMTQTDIAHELGVCQATVAQTLKTVLRLVKEEFYGNL